MTLRRLLAVARGGGAFAASGSLLALFNGSQDGLLYAIGAASYNGSTWTEAAGNPVLQKGAGGTWDDDHVKDPCLIWDGSQYVCYYAGHDGTKYQIGRATATSHEGTWTKAAGNPVLAVGSGGAFDDAGVNFPTVLYEPTDTGKEWKCWYGADDGSTQRVGYAYSSDGLSWTKVGQVLTIGAGGTWNDVGVLPMAIYKDGATYNLFVGGRQGTTNPRWQGGLWTFTNPEGTYTADSGNPILLARFNDSGTSQSLSANATAPTTTATMGSTAAFNVGEPVVLADANSTAEVFYVVSIDSGTQITVDHATTADFTTAQGAVFRSFAFNSVLPRSVLANGGGYQMFGTPFQPVEDLTQPASKLWEGSFRWTASALDGPWSYDYVAGRGVLFPFTVSWHSRSAENPSVIAAP